MRKSMFEDIALDMQKRLAENNLNTKPSLTKMAECLRSAINICEEVGLNKKANEIISILSFISKNIEKKAASTEDLLNLDLDSEMEEDTEIDEDEDFEDE